MRARHPQPPALLYPGSIPGKQEPEYKIDDSADDAADIREHVHYDGREKAFRLRSKITGQKSQRKRKENDDYECSEIGSPEKQRKMHAGEKRRGNQNR